MRCNEKGTLNPTGATTIHKKSLFGRTPQQKWLQSGKRLLSENYSTCMYDAHRSHRLKQRSAVRRRKEFRHARFALHCSILESLRQLMPGFQGVALELYSPVGNS